MKICYIAHESNLTGANRSLMDILSCCKKNQVEPLVIIPKKGMIEEELNKMKIKYKIIKYKTCIDSNFIKNKLKIILNYLAIIKIEKILKEENIDIVHNNSLLIDVGIKAAYNLKLPYICHIREFGIEDHNLKFLNQKELFSYLENARYIIGISKCIFDKFSKLVSNDNFKLIYNGVNFKEHNQMKKNLLDNNKINMIIVGRICEGKGQLEAIKAIEYLINEGINNLKLYIVGDGIKGEKYYNKLKIYVFNKKLSNYVKFIPFTKDLREFRKNCDIALICSRNEAFGRVTIESMLAKQLVIGANTGGTIELIENKVTGLLYEQGNYINLSENIKFAIENKDKSKEMIKAGYIKAKENFLIERTMSEVKKLYSEINKNGIIQ